MALFSIHFDSDLSNVAFQFLNAAEAGRVFAPEKLHEKHLLPPTWHHIHLGYTFPEQALFLVKLDDVFMGGPNGVFYRDCLIFWFVVSFAALFFFILYLRKCFPLFRPVAVRVNSLI